MGWWQGKRPARSLSSSPAAKRSMSGAGAGVGGSGEGGFNDSDEEHMDTSNWSAKDQESLQQIETALMSGNLDPNEIKTLKKQRRAMRNRASATASRQRKKEYLQNLESHMSELTASNQLLNTSVAEMKAAETARNTHVAHLLEYRRHLSAVREEKRNYHVVHAPSSSAGLTRLSRLCVFVYRLASRPRRSAHSCRKSVPR